MKMVKAKKDIVGGPHLYKKYISFCYSFHALAIYEKMPHPTFKIEISSYFLNEEKQMIKRTKEKQMWTTF